MSILKPLIIRIEACDVKVNTEERKLASGQIRVIHTQPALAVLSGRSMSEINIPIDGDDIKPYPVGDYIVAADSFSANKYHNLEFNPYTVKLIPLDAIKPYLNK